MSTPTATASTSIRATPEAVYAVVSDLDAMAGLAAETESMVWTKGDAGQVGSTFTGANRNGSKTWKTACTVTSADVGSRFAFDVRALRMRVAVWAYDLEPTGDGGTRVTESTWDLRPGWFKRPGGWATGEMDRTGANLRHIETTLAALKAHCEA